MLSLSYWITVSQEYVSYFMVNLKMPKHEISPGLVFFCYTSLIWVSLLRTDRRGLYAHWAASTCSMLSLKSHALASLISVIPAYLFMSCIGRSDSWHVSHIFLTKHQWLSRYLALLLLLIYVRLGHTKYRAVTVDKTQQTPCTHVPVCNSLPVCVRMKGYILQMKGRWEFNINVWFPFMYSQK